MTTGDDWKAQRLEEERRIDEYRSSTIRGFLDAARDFGVPGVDQATETDYGNLIVMTHLMRRVQALEEVLRDHGLLLNLPTREELQALVEPDLPTCPHGIYGGAGCLPCKEARS